MNRRDLLRKTTVLGSMGIAGCSQRQSSRFTSHPDEQNKNESEGRPTPTNTPEPTPANFDIIVEDEEAKIYEPWDITFTVRNSGGKPGVIVLIPSKQTPSDSGSVRDLQGLSGHFRVYVPGGGETKVSRKVAPVTEPIPLKIVLRAPEGLGYRTQFTVEFKRTESVFKGRTDKENTIIDLQYRDYTDGEIGEIVSESTKIKSFETLRKSDPRLFRGRHIYEEKAFVADITDVIQKQNYFVYSVDPVNHETSSVLVSSVERNYSTGDRVKIWAQFLGNDVHTNRQPETSVCFAAAEMELV